jgi:hypothetical protein
MIMLGDGVDGWQMVVDHLFVGPMWPASILAGLVLSLVVISLIGAFAADFGDANLDVDPGVDVGMDVDAGMHLEAGVDVDPGLDADTSTNVETSMPAHGHHVSGDLLGGLVAATLRAVRLDRVPLMIWLSVFTLLFWVLSFVLWFEFDVFRYPPTIFASAMLTIRNGVLALVLTRFMTSPLHRLLIPPTHYHPVNLIGGVAIVETSLVDASFGRARFATNAAPLLLDIRTAGESIPKGTQVRIIRFDSSRKVYLVEADLA